MIGTVKISTVCADLDDIERDTVPIIGRNECRDKLLSGRGRWSAPPRLQVGEREARPPKEPLEQPVYH